MGRESYLPLFFGDLLASTAEWAGEEVSLYLTLLGHQWTLGSLPADAEKVRRLVRWESKAFNRAWGQVREKFQESDGRLTNPRLEEHRKHSHDVAKKRADAGAKGAAARKQSESKPEAIATDLLEPTSSIHPIHPSYIPPPPSGAPPTPTTPFPEGFVLDDEMAAYATGRLPDVNAAALFEQFRESALAKRREYADWRAAWRTWVGNCTPRSGSFADGKYPRLAGRKSVTVEIGGRVYD